MLLTSDVKKPYFNLLAISKVKKSDAMNGHGLQLTQTQEEGEEEEEEEEEIGRKLSSQTPSDIDVFIHKVGCQADKGRKVFS